MADTLDLASVPDRRRDPRRAGSDIASFSGARLRPGLRVDVVNISAGGALIEARSRLLPGARVFLQFPGPGTCRVVSGRLSRCFIRALCQAGGPRYRGAIIFDEPFDVTGKSPNPAGYDLPTDGGRARTDKGNVLLTHGEVRRS